LRNEEYDTRPLLNIINTVIALSAQLPKPSLSKTRYFGLRLIPVWISEDDELGHLYKALSFFFPKKRSFVIQQMNQALVRSNVKALLLIQDCFNQPVSSNEISIITGPRHTRFLVGNDPWKHHPIPIAHYPSSSSSESLQFLLGSSG
jgi:hypothetical protein